MFNAFLLYNLDIFLFLVLHNLDKVTFIILHNLDCGTFTVLRTPYCGTLLWLVAQYTTYCINCNVLVCMYRIVAHFSDSGHLYYGVWCIVFWLVSQYAPATEAVYTVLRLVCIVLCFAAPFIRLMAKCTPAFGALYSGMCALSCCTLHSSLRHIVLL